MAHFSLCARKYNTLHKNTHYANIIKVMNVCREIYDSVNLDAIIICSKSNTFYLSGFESSNCQIVITKDNQYFITDDRYVNEAKLLLSDRFKVLSGDLEMISFIVKDAKTIGWDSDVTYQTYKMLYDEFGNKLVDIQKVVEEFRMIKSQKELENIIKAQSITDHAFSEVLKDLKEGVSEIEIAAKIEYIFLKNGAELAFDSIVAFGENGASPHAHRTFRQLKVGDLVTMDIGAKWKGYCSDMTRTVGFGQLSQKQIDVYNLVLCAQETAEKNIKAGMSGYEADRIARDIIENNGYGEYFTHSLGHSVGVDIHEKITLAKASKNDIIKNGMVVTVEPGIYIPNKFGVRIEDTVLIKDNIANSLAKSDKKLIIL